MGHLRSIFGMSAEEKHASKFFENALGFVANRKYELAGISAILDNAIKNPEFNFYLYIVCLAASDMAAIIKYGPESKIPTKLLGLMIKCSEKENPHVRINLMFHKDFLDQMDIEGRLKADNLTIPHASGCWILMALTNENTTDLDDPKILEAGKILGEWIYGVFGKYWD